MTQTKWPLLIFSRQFGLIKDLCHPQIISDEKCYLYRSTSRRGEDGACREREGGFQHVYVAYTYIARCYCCTGTVLGLGDGGGSGERRGWEEG